MPELPPPKDIRERTFVFALRVIKLCQALEPVPGVQRTLGRQLLRSGTSIGANVEEAHGGQSKAEVASKMAIACKEARETHYWLRLITASALVPETRLTDLSDEASQLIAILTSIVKKCRPAAD